MSLVDSVAVSPRTPAVTVPYITAFASANSAPIVNVSVPGLVTISTPKKPTRIADQRAMPTCSRNRMIEASVAKIGAEKLIATALASGISENAIIRNVCEHDCEAPRSRWPLSRVVRNTASPVRGRMMIESPISGMNTRENNTSPIG